MSFSKGISQWFSVGFPADFNCLPVGFSAVLSGLQVAEVGTQSKIQLCVKCRDLVKIFIFRSGVVFTPKVGMKHVDRRWKSYLVRNKGKSPESKHEATKF